MVRLTGPHWPAVTTLAHILLPFPSQIISAFQVKSWRKVERIVSKSVRSSPWHNPTLYSNGQMPSFIQLIVDDWTRNTIGNHQAQCQVWRQSKIVWIRIRYSPPWLPWLFSLGDVKCCGYSPRRNESFKPSIITQQITTQGYTMMAAFCWNLFIIRFLSTLLFRDAQACPALSLVLNSSACLRLSSDRSVLSVPGCLIITFNEEIFSDQYTDPPPSVPTKRDIIYFDPAIFSHSQRWGLRVTKKVFAPFKAV